MLVDAAFTDGRKHVGGLQSTTGWAGTWFSAKTLKTNPSTPHQNALRHRFARVATHWRSVLTPTEQAGWSDYAAAVPWPNVDGSTTFLTGPAMFQAANVTRLTAGLSILSTPPPSNSLANFTVPTIAFRADGDVDVTINPADGWAKYTGGCMVISVLSPTKPMQARHGRQARVLVAILGNTASPPPATRTVPNPFVNPNIYTQQIGVHVTARYGHVGPLDVTP